CGNRDSHSARRTARASLGHAALPHRAALKAGLVKNSPLNTTPSFMFATGIENSYPTIEGGRVRVDEMESCGHYDLWRRDFDLVQEMGICYLRYGPPLHRVWLGSGKYDWSFADATYHDLRERDIVTITDLCHFGVPDWIGNFQ